MEQAPAKPAENDASLTPMIPFQWEGKLFTTRVSISVALERLIGTRKQAETFFAECAATNGKPWASLNIGFLCGELDIPECDRLLRLFDLVHPYVTNTPRTINAILGVGLRLGEHAAVESLEARKAMQIIKPLLQEKVPAKVDTGPVILVP